MKGIYFYGNDDTYKVAYFFVKYKLKYRYY